MSLTYEGHCSKRRSLFVALAASPPPTGLYRRQLTLACVKRLPSRPSARLRQAVQCLLHFL